MIDTKYVLMSSAKEPVGIFPSVFSACKHLQKKFNFATIRLLTTKTQTDQTVFGKDKPTMTENTSTTETHQVRVEGATVLHYTIEPLNSYTE